MKKCENAPVLRQLNVESAAKRRDFRYAERQRLQNLAEVKTERKPGPEKVIFFIIISTILLLLINHIIDFVETLSKV